MNGARHLVKRVLGIEIEHCARCGGRLKVIASIEEPELFERMLAHRPDDLDAIVRVDRDIADRELRDRALLGFLYAGGFAPSLRLGFVKVPDAA